VSWLLIMVAPGRPGSTGGGAVESSAEEIGDAAKEQQQNEAQRNFRRDFGLDRPRFVNTWYDLEPDDIHALVTTAAGSVEDFGVAPKREARETLEDYGKYAVPPLMELLNRADLSDEDRFEVLRWLIRSSYSPLIRSGSRRLSEEERRINRERVVENSRLGKLKWRRGAPAEEREKIVGQWNEWFEKHQARWELDTLEKFKVTLTDTQFGHYWGRLLRGDLGISHVHKQPVIRLVLDRMKYSIALNVTALLLMYLLAVPLGIFAAVKQGGYFDRISGVVVFGLYSLPSFFTGLLLQQWFSVGEPWKLFPLAGFESETAGEMNAIEHLQDIGWHIILPLVTLTYGGLAALSRFSRTGMLDVIRSDYVRTARAKGVKEFRVITRHVVRNGILPIVTILGSSLPVIIGGSVAVEYIFGINGMGLLMIQSIFAKDFNVIMGVTLMVGVLTMVGILIADITYAILDPRISLK